MADEENQGTAQGMASEMSFSKMTSDDLVTQIFEQSFKAYSIDEKLKPAHVISLLEEEERDKLMSEFIEPLL